MATFSNIDIMNKHQVGNCGGIRKSNRTQSFVLIINPSVQKYNDIKENGNDEIMYDGQFTKGSRDQLMKKMNKALEETHWPLHVYEGTRDRYRYIGEYERSGSYHTIFDDQGRRVFVFPIRKKYPFDSFEY